MLKYAISRRNFIQKAITAGVYLGCLGSSGCLYGGGYGWHLEHLPQIPDTTRRLPKHTWNILAAAQDRLLPSSSNSSGKKKSPGARDVHATKYLEGAMIYKYIEPDQVAVILDGAKELDVRAGTLFSSNFPALEPKKQDATLKNYQTDRASRAWFDVMIALTMEAFLGDPVHGGNPGGVAWKWADIQPGFPRPDKDSLHCWSRT